MIRNDKEPHYKETKKDLYRIRVESLKKLIEGD